MYDIVEKVSMILKLKILNIEMNMIMTKIDDDLQLNLQKSKFIYINKGTVCPLRHTFSMNLVQSEIRC